MSEADDPAAESQVDRQPLLTWALRSFALAFLIASMTAAFLGWVVERRDLTVPGGIGVGLATLVGWIIDGIEGRRGVAKKGLSGIPVAARVGLWLITTGAIAVLLLALGGILGAVVGLVMGRDWKSEAWEGVRGGGLLGGGLFLVGLVVFGVQWMIEKVLPPAPKGPNGRWIAIDGRAQAAWMCALIAGAAAAVVLALGGDAAGTWVRPSGLLCAAAAIVLTLLAIHRATRPGALRVERLGGS